MINIQEIDGLKIACGINEEGFVEGRKNLVFIHGSGNDHTVWKSQYNAMDKDYNIAAVDLPGHGSSEGGGEQDVQAYVEWVKKIIGKLGLKKPVLIGHSLGAAISLTFAIKYGEMLSGIIPVGGGVKMPVNQIILDGIRQEPSSVIALAAKFSISRKNRERLSGWLTDSLTSVTPEVIYGDFLSCNRLDITEEILQIKIPTLLVCGDDDKMTPPALSQFMKDRIPGAEMSLIEGAGHFAMLENVKMFNRVLKNFVDSLPSLLPAKSDSSRHKGTYKNGSVGSISSIS
ncbi:MAG: alpha/beta hydrolase [Proteobacteria bacterium]|nr:alpha/beta hydrolase [Pseudomonadota bacterium]